MTHRFIFGIFPDRHPFCDLLKSPTDYIIHRRSEGKKNTPLAVLNGWKQIAKYLGASPRSVQRYERLGGLPVRRPTGRSRGAVLATKAELDAWVNARPLKHTYGLRPSVPNDYAVALATFKIALAEQRQLREEMRKGREDHHAALELFRVSLRAVQDEFAGKLKRRPTSAVSASEKLGIM
jgi:hypothetical protein